MNDEIKVGDTLVVYMPGTFNYYWFAGTVVRKTPKRFIVGRKHSTSEWAFNAEKETTKMDGEHYRGVGHRGMCYPVTNEDACRQYRKFQASEYVSGGLSRVSSKLDALCRKKIPVTDESNTLVSELLQALAKYEAATKNEGDE